MWHNYSWLLKDSQNENSYLMSLPSFNVTTDSDESLECLLKKINPWTKSEDTTNTGSTNRESDQLIFIGVDKSNRKTAAGFSRSQSCFFYSVFSVDMENTEEVESLCSFT